jgi:hypothetical protein
MKIRRITTAGAPLGAATRTGGLSGTSPVTAGTGLFGSRGFDRVPELPPRPEHVPGGKPGSAGAPKPGPSSPAWPDQQKMRGNHDERTPRKDRADHGR